MYSLLRWLHDHGKSIETLCLADLDAYIASRVVVMKRRSKAEVISTLRGVLRYLFDSNQTPTDLADAVEGPIIYEHGGYSDDNPSKWTSIGYWKLPDVIAHP